MWRKALWLVLPVFLAAVFFSRPAAAQTPTVLVVDVDTPIYPAVVSYLERGLAAAETQGAQALVLQLNTPGGDGESMLSIVSLVRSAPVPVVVYVAPAGAQAASAGSIITLAGHVAAMAPETVIGAASPVGSAGEDLEETLYRKAVEDIKATTRSLTVNRPPEAQSLAEQMVEDARAVSADEALDIGLIDLITPNLETLLMALDGRTVQVRNQPHTLQTAGALVEHLPWSRLEQLQLFLANPLLLSLLISLGSIALITEIRSPGGWGAGFVGVVCLSLAFYGLGQLPTNLLGLVLIGLAFALLLLETQTPTLGALAITGMVSLVAGLWILFNATEAPAVARLPLWGALGVGIPTGLLFLWIVVAAARIHRRPARTGAEGMVGLIGRATTDFKLIEGRFIGTAVVWGEVWRAEAQEAITAQQGIMVESVTGFTLHVKPTYIGAKQDVTQASA